MHALQQILAMRADSHQCRALHCGKVKGSLQCCLPFQRCNLDLKAPDLLVLLLCYALRFHAPDDRLVRGEEQLQHCDSWRELPAGHVGHVADGPRSLKDDHLMLVAQAGLEELEEGALLPCQPRA